MADSQPQPSEQRRRTASREVARYFLAMEDMLVVELGSRLLARYRPDLVYFRMYAEHGPGLFKSPELLAVLEASQHPLVGHPVTGLTETGLVITYARPFVSGRPGFPLPRNRFVPEALRDTHDELLTLRHKLYAHDDADETLVFRREVLELEEPAPDGGDPQRWVQRQGAWIFTETQLSKITMLATTVHERLNGAFEAAREYERLQGNGEAETKTNTGSRAAS